MDPLSAAMNPQWKCPKNLATASDLLQSETKCPCHAVK